MEFALKKMVQEDKSLIKKMTTELTNLVNEKGGFIDTRNLNHENDSIYVIIYDEGDERYKEQKVAAVATFNGDNGTSDDCSLCVLPQDEMDCDWETATKDEMLEDENWYSLYGGMCWINASVVAIAESIEQYV